MEEEVKVEVDTVVGGGGGGARESLVYMWGYLPGATRQRAPLPTPVNVRLPPSSSAGFSWRDVCDGGLGFAMAITDTGKLATWGSTDDLGQSYVTSGNHGELPEPFPLPTGASVVQAAAGWAHCVAVTDQGQVYTWGWKECVPSGNTVGDSDTSSIEANKDVFDHTNFLVGEQETLFTVSPRSQTSRVVSGSGSDDQGGGDDNKKRRRVSSKKQATESSTSSEESHSALPCLVTLNVGVRIATVAAGGRHTLALSDAGQVWGWGYGGEGQLGLGSRIKMVSYPHLIPLTELSTYAKAKPSYLSRGGAHSDGQGFTYITEIACGGRHSTAITDGGALLSFGWGLYGQCGQGSTDDELSPIYVSSLLGIRIEKVSTGLWHTVCISSDGDVYSFGGNQFGQLGTGEDQAEALPRLLDASTLENIHVKGVSCGARHTAVITDEGRVFSWGWNKYGQLGLGDVVDRNIPSEVKIDGCVPKNVACGWWHTLLHAEKEQPT